MSELDGTPADQRPLTSRGLGGAGAQGVTASLCRDTLGPWLPAVYPASWSCPSWLPPHLTGTSTQAAPAWTCPHEQGSEEAARGGRGRGQARCRMGKGPEYWARTGGEEHGHASWWAPGAERERDGSGSVAFCCVPLSSLSPGRASPWQGEQTGWRLQDLMGAGDQRTWEGWGLTCSRAAIKEPSRKGP